MIDMQRKCERQGCENAAEDDFRYCSDECYDDDYGPPVIPLSHGRAMSARPWMSIDDRLREGRTN